MSASRFARVSLALAALAGCQIVGTQPPAGFKCEDDGTCSEGMTCCDDGKCRVDCNPVSSGCSPACTGAEQCVNGTCEATDGGGGCVPVCTGSQQCVNGTCETTDGGGCVPACSGTQQCVNGTCENIGPSCTEGAACTGNSGAPCRTGATACDGGVPCIDGAGASNGTHCDGGDVCSSGACVPCAEGKSCETNPTPCHNGAQSCGASGPSCDDAPGERDAGSACGTKKVCSPAGTCIDCAGGDACMTNPTPCKNGVVQCTGGVVTCADSTPRGAGTSCGTGKVCDGAGGCITCVDGAACMTNPGAPCKSGKLSCTGGSAACVDSVAAMEGGTCAVSTFSAYSACSYAAMCSDTGSRTRTRTDHTCMSGTCGTSTATETDVAGCNRTQDGMGCGAETCGAYGACGYTSQCITSGSRSRTCTDFACSMSTCPGTDRTDVDMTGCGRATVDAACTGGFCDGSGTCVACSGACTTNPSRCAAGVAQWNTGTHTCDCIDGAVKTNGQACNGTPAGECWSGACCTGCWDGTACQVTSTRLHCGKGGDYCDVCDPGCACLVSGFCDFNCGVGGIK